MSVSCLKEPYENYFWKIRTTVTSVNHSRQFCFLLWLTHTRDRFEDSSRVYIYEIFLYPFTHVEIARDFTTTFQVMLIIASWNRRNSERGQIKRNILFETNLRSASVYTKRMVLATSSVSEIFAFFRISCVTLGAKKIEADGTSPRGSKKLFVTIYNCCVIVWIIVSRVAAFFHLSLRDYFISDVCTLWNCVFFSHYTYTKERHGFRLSNFITTTSEITLSI